MPTKTAQSLIPDSWLDLPKKELLEKVEAEVAKKQKALAGRQQKYEQALDAVFDKHATDGRFLPQEFVVAHTLVRLKPAPGAFAQMKAALLGTLKRLEGTRFHTEKGVGKGVQRLSAKPAKKGRG